MPHKKEVVSTQTGSKKPALKHKNKAKFGVHIHCQEGFIPDAINEVVTSNDKTSFKIVPTVGEAQILIIDNKDVWEKVKKKWRGNVVIHACDKGEESCKMFGKVRYFRILTSHIALFFFLNDCATFFSRNPTTPKKGS